MTRSSNGEGLTGMAWTGSLGEQNLEQVSAALAEHFEITRMIDATESVEHYLAREKTSGNSITLRVLPAVAARDFRRREMFYLEAYSAIKLAHPNVVRSSKPEQVKGTHFVMLARTGREESLRDRLDRGGWFDTETAIEIASQVGAAIESAHNARVLHLELNPASVFIEPDGRAMVEPVRHQRRARDGVGAKSALSPPGGFLPQP